MRNVSIAYTSKSVGKEGKVGIPYYVISGLYLIRKNDSSVFDLNGTFYGHTILWVDPGGDSPRENQTFMILPGANNWKAHVKSLGSMDVRLNTYFGPFGPPVSTIRLVGGDPQLPGGVEMTPAFRTSIVYDPSTGLVFVPPSTLPVAMFPDLAAIGIHFALFTDQKGMYTREHDKATNWPSGILLYDTNAQFQEVETVPFSEAGTPTKYVFYASLLLLEQSLELKAHGG
ncbi:hypothetical protein [Thermococcus sp. JCM 11816]|uniref:hypothetical protein n=1 Tax=Thermococcus sp. (strain JCM 11816 / KS-1) TaxID=1295125 RepID=UPI0006D17147